MDIRKIELLAEINTVTANLLSCEWLLRIM